MVRSSSSVVASSWRAVVGVVGAHLRICRDRCRSEARAWTVARASMLCSSCGPGLILESVSGRAVRRRAQGGTLPLEAPCAVFRLTGRLARSRVLKVHWADKRDVQGFAWCVKVEASS